MTEMRRPGVILLEVVLALSLVLGILVLFTAALTQFTSNNDVILARQRAYLAAESVLNELRAGVVVDRADFEERFDNMSIEDIQRRPGEGRWSGLTHVFVVVRTVAGRGGTTIRARLDGYMREADS